MSRSLRTEVGPVPPAAPPGARGWPYAVGYAAIVVALSAPPIFLLSRLINALVDRLLWSR